MRSILLVLAVSLAAMGRPEFSNGDEKPPAGEYGGGYEKKKPLTPIQQRNEEIRQEQFDKYVDLTDELPNPLLTLLQNYDMVEDLKLSLSQVAALAAMELPNPSQSYKPLIENLKPAIAATKHVEVLSQFVIDYRLAVATSDAELADILDDKQMKRLRQIRFQRLAVMHPNLKGALAAAKLTSPSSSGELKKGFAAIKKEARTSRKFAAFAIVKEMLVEIVGEAAVARASGKTFYANDRERSAESRIEELMDMKPSAKQESRRR